MALDSTKTGKKIAQILTDGKASPAMAKKIEDTWVAIIDAVFADLRSDMEVTVPSGSVIVAVAGSATGTPNPAPIKNGVL